MAETRTLASLRPPPELRPLRLREFKQLRELIYEEAGIHLPDSKRSLVESRLSRRLRALRLCNYEDYCAVVSAKENEAERVEMLDCITTNETHFFREPKHFEFLERVAFPRWAEAALNGERAKRLRIWSAACSTGEEPFTLAMCSALAFPPESGWQVDILASDISTRVLSRAQEATWPIDKAKEIPERHLRRFMLRGFGDREGELRCGPELRRMVRFSRINLRRAPYTVSQLDLIFCRNVLIYFDAESRAQVIDAMVDRLSPTGYLVVGHSESLHNVSRRVALVAPGVYVRAGAREQEWPRNGAEQP
jgi:chemotaxis protein methyltransferase CheR